ncbi:hypothetical protein DFH07DRAFT_134531 [Mycena maculata]|uniref:BHLH domain-containing protein n=1 Tax=Mycena maculata TaxID=230809 RepID=A0AAD7I2I0_9AGAR|nr:hypothetical protein DFH07DRAFT_134531 [Mycena maculata]
MDPHHHHPHHQMEPDPSMATNSYGFYASEQEQPYPMAYPHPQMPPYQVQVQHNGQQARQLELQQQHNPIQQYHTLISSHQYQSPVYPPSPPHALPIPASPPPPPSPDMYDPLSPPLSGSDTSADGIYHSNSSGPNSPSSSRANSLVQRQVRYNPTPSPTSSSGRRRRGQSQDSDDEDMNLLYTESNLAQNRKEATRRQRIEAEQRRRDELRDGYAKLKDVLPVSNQKSSKVSLLDRATNHISVLESENKVLQDRIAGLEEEIRRLQTINDKLSGGSLETPSPGMYERPLSPPPEVTTLHSHSSLAGATGPLEPPEEASPSPTDSGY